MSAEPFTSSRSTRRPERDADWVEIAAEYHIRPDTLYLNHGSFGIPPRVVRGTRRQWIDAVDAQPMDCYVRQMEPAFRQARETLGRFVGTSLENLVFVENATFGMNVVAHNFPLGAGDEILLNPHEYGAVRRIWQQATERTGAQIVDLQLPNSFDDPEELVDAIANQISPRAKLLVISHITSPTALIFPIQAICSRMRQRGLAICIDGPHAPAHIPLDVDALDCDYYVASCHKWMAATLGSGFLYVHPRRQSAFRPLVRSWGRLLPAMPARWDEEFTWTGTRDPSVYLSVPTAIDFLESIGLESIRERLYWLARYAEDRLTELFTTEPLGRRSSYRWYGTMAHVPLPPGDWSQLQSQLWSQSGIEIPIIEFQGAWYVRVSCYLYNSSADIDTLCDALRKLVRTP